MRLPLACVTVLALAGCGGTQGLPQPLDVLEVSSGGPAPWDGRSLGYERDVECPEGTVHRLQVQAPGLDAADAQAPRWRLVWGDGHRTGVMYADGLQAAPGDPLTVNLGGCPPEASLQVTAVEVMDSNGRRIGRDEV